METPVAMITGASRGIGAAVAVELARGGYDIAILGPSKPRDTAARIGELGRRVLAYQGDVTSVTDRAGALHRIEQEMGRLDVLVNNAGVAPAERTDILQADEESFDRVVSVNLKGPYFLTQAVANWMILQRRQRTDARMCIVNITSVSAYVASVNRGDYCLSKAGAAMATKLWAMRLAEFGINVYEVRPGVIATDMTRPVKDKYDRLIADGLTPIRRWGQPEDVARAVASCALGSLPYSTGEVINVDGGFHLRSL